MTGQHSRSLNPHPPSEVVVNLHLIGLGFLSLLIVAFGYAVYTFGGVDAFSGFSIGVALVGVSVTSCAMGKYAQSLPRDRTVNRWGVKLSDEQIYGKAKRPSPPVA